MDIPFAHSLTSWYGADTRALPVPLHTAQGLPIGGMAGLPGASAAPSSSSQRSLRANPGRALV